MTTPRQIVDLQLRAARDISKREVSASTLLVIPYGELKMLLQDTADQAFEAGQKSEPA